MRTTRPRKCESLLSLLLCLVSCILNVRDGMYHSLARVESETVRKGWGVLVPIVSMAWGKTHEGGLRLVFDVDQTRAPRQ